MFSEAFKQIPLYVKLMKDIILKKRPTNTEPVLLTETCSAILYGMKIPMNKKDRWSVNIPCTIENRTFKKALIDLGASVSLMPLSIYRKMGIGTVQDTMMTLQFDVHSVKIPYGVVEDILVKIDKFFFPVDFVILEMPKEDEITLKVSDEELKIDVWNTIKYKDDVGTNHTIEVIDQVISQGSPMKTPHLPLEWVIAQGSPMKTPIFENDEERDEIESEVLAIME